MGQKIKNCGANKCNKCLMLNGKAVYLIGVDDNGKIYSLNESILNETIRYVKIISKKIGARVRVIRIYKNKVCSVRIILNQEILEDKMENMMLY